MSSDNHQSSSDGLRGRADENTISQRKERLERLTYIINDKSRDGVFGLVEVAEGRGALQDPVHAELKKEIEELSKAIDEPDSWLFGWLNSTDSVDNKIGKLTKKILAIVDRRERFGALYKAAYKEVLPPLPDEHTLSVTFPPTQPELLNRSGPGIEEAITEALLPLESWTQSDSVRAHDMALFLLCKKSIPLIEDAYSSMENQLENQRFLLEHASVLQSILIEARDRTKKKTALVNYASQIFAGMDELRNLAHDPQYLDEEKRKVINDSFQTIKSAIENELADSNTGSKGKHTGNLEDVIYQDIVAEELWYWNASDEELLAWESNKDVTSTKPWESSHFSKIDADRFTYEFISKRIPAITKLPVLFNSPPNLDISADYDTGGFGNVCSVVLEEDIESPLYYTTSGPEKISKVAVKTISFFHSNERTCIRLAREARIWSKMRHQHILPLIGFWKNFDRTEISGSLAFIAPWIHQGNLSQFLKNNRQLELVHKLRIMRDIASALIFMHNQKYPVTHSDLKSNNILLKENRAYICDFGISSILDGVRGLTTDDHGNVRWKSPEQLVKETSFKVTVYCDMYSYGSIFLEVLTGRLPWMSIGTNNLAVETFRTKNPAATEERPAGVEKDEYWQFISQCWRLEPTLRPTANVAYHLMDAFQHQG